MHYCIILWHLKEVIWMEHPGSLTKKVILFHDKTYPNTVGVTTQLVEQLCWECLAYPPYNPDLVPSNYHIIRTLKKCFEGKHFQHDDEVSGKMCCWVQTQP
jgi:hypothetical protein